MHFTFLAEYYYGYDYLTFCQFNGVRVHIVWIVTIIKKSIVTNTLVQVFEHNFGSFEYMFKSGIAGPYNNCMYV